MPGDVENDARQRIAERLSGLVNFERERRFHEGRVRCDLEGMRALLHVLGHPERSFVAVHITGSWGKGSTATYAASVLDGRGFRVGLFTSPHLVDVAERVRLGGSLVDARLLDQCLSEVFEAAREVRCRPTYFEVLTSAAFVAFRRVACDVAVVEVGLGGRLDATNTVYPTVCAITAISLEHTRVLGSTLEDIAREKAGIFKPDVPVVLGELLPGPRAVVLERARALGCPLVQPRLECAVDESGGCRVMLAGTGAPAKSFRLAEGPAFRATCAGLGLALADMATERLGPRAGPVLADQAALERVRMPGRFQVICGEPRVIVDGAHSPEGVQAVLQAAKTPRRGERLLVVLGLLADKEADGVLRALAVAKPRLLLTRVPSPRARDPKELADKARRVGLVPRTVDDPHEALAEARRRAGPGGTVLVLGSLYLAGVFLRPADVARVF
ncbi:MAG: folylpolyglutamate synthase/dihydrofolate synthase family protein [Planctomycetota bacterium]